MNSAKDSEDSNPTPVVIVPVASMARSCINSVSLTRNLAKPRTNVPMVNHDDTMVQDENRTTQITQDLAKFNMLRNCK